MRSSGGLYSPALVGHKPYKAAIFCWYACIENVCNTLSELPQNGKTRSLTGGEVSSMALILDLFLSTVHLLVLDLHFLSLTLLVFCS